MTNARDDIPPAIRAFEAERDARCRALRHNDALRAISEQWRIEAARAKHSYNFQWCGRPVIQLPDDIVAVQELIWRVQPDLVIETGIAHGGSLILSASILHALGGERRVLGIDVDIRAHNRAALEAHPLFERITLLEGSSVDRAVIDQVYALAQDRTGVLVILDSNHAHDHVLAELRAYAPLVTSGSYLVVFDTIIEDLPADFFPDRPWGPGNNPKTALDVYLRECDRFEVDEHYADKLLLTAAPGGYLRCIKP